jgi:hypothetical protein
LFDGLINGDLSDMNTKVTQYVLDGDSTEEARKKASAEFGQQLFESFMGGAVSGGIMSFGASAWSGHKTKIAGSAIIAQHRTGVLLDMADTLGAGQKQIQLAESNPTAKNIGNLWMDTLKVASEKSTAALQSNRSGISERLVSLGMNRTGADKAAGLVIDKYTGNKLNLAERLFYNKSEQAHQVYDELAALQSTGTAAEWIPADVQNAVAQYTETVNLVYGDLRELADTPDNSVQKNAENVQDNSAVDGAANSELTYEQKLLQGAGMIDNHSAGGIIDINGGAGYGQQGEIRSAKENSIGVYGGRVEAPYGGRTEGNTPKRKSTRRENRQAFTRGIQSVNGKTEGSGRSVVGYKEAQADGSELYGAVETFKRRGIKAIYADGEILTNNGEITTSHPNAVTAPNGTVYVSNTAELPANHIVAHESVHSRENTGDPAYAAYYESIYFAIDMDSATYRDMSVLINNAHFNSEMDIDDIDSIPKIMRELVAYISEFVMTEPQRAEELFGGMFGDWDAVVQAVRQFNNTLKESGSGTEQGSFFDGEKANAPRITEPDLRDESNLGMEDKIVRRAEYGYVRTEGHSQVERIAKKLGRRVIWDCKFGDGYIDNAGNIHLAPTTVDPVTQVFKHELTHFLQKHRIAYTQFADRVIASKVFKNWLHSKGYASVKDMNLDIQKKYALRKNIRCLYDGCALPCHCDAAYRDG